MSSEVTTYGVVAAPRHRGRRRWRAGLCVAVLLVGAAAIGQRVAAPTVDAPALGGFAVDDAGHVALVTGTRTVSAAEQSWLASGSVPTTGGLDPRLTRDALLDLRVLTVTDGVTVAGWPPAWRYVWPRDSAFVASAFARTGHLAEASAQLDFLQRVQAADGRFQARYVAATGLPPDDRGVELDGSGWAVWSLAQVVATLPEPSRASYVTRYRALLDRSVAASLDSLDPTTHLPPASLDYWELRERRTTLATAAVLLAGLRSAETLYAEVDDTDAAGRAAVGADALAGAIRSRFGPGGYPRRLGGPASSVDLGVTFLMPPFAGVTAADARTSWAEAPARMGRPGGGLAPGGSWREKTVSWTPTVATYAVAASCLDPAAALRWLGWLDDHRTSTGSLPEKVNAAGEPVSVAPLAWTAAAVVIAADQLQHGCPAS